LSTPDSGAFEVERRRPTVMDIVLTELPTFCSHQALKRDAVDTFSVANKGDLTILKRAGVFIGDND
jgi:hypothetical protein